MKYGLLSLALLINCSNVIAASESGPSFDCANAKPGSEQLICAKPELAELDKIVARYYLALKSHLVEDRKEALVEAQRHWIAKRDQCAKNVQCLDSIYKNRISELRVTLNGEWIPPESENIAEIEALCAKESQIGSVQYEITYFNNGNLPKSTIRRKAMRAIRKGEYQGAKWESITDGLGEPMKCDWLLHSTGHHIHLVSEDIVGRETLDGKPCVKIELGSQDFQNGGSSVETVWVWEDKGLPAKTEWRFEGPEGSTSTYRSQSGNFSFEKIPDAAFDLW